jgi:hypothetical protein
MHAVIILLALAVAFVTGVVLARQIIAELRSVRSSVSNDLQALHLRLSGLEASLKSKLRK